MDRLLATVIQQIRIAVALFAVAVNAPAAVGYVLVEAHRGYSAIAPENTIASIDAAVGIADLTEFDVRATADGELVLMHDITVDRTTDGSGSVTSLTLAQIQTLDAGYPDKFGSTFAGEQVPTMSEAISFSQSVGIVPLIERKAGSAQTYHDEFVNTGLAAADFRMISFTWSFLDNMDALNSNYNLGALGSGSLTQSTIDGLQAQGIDFIDWNHGLITQSEVDLAHANNMELHVWTVNDSARMQELIDFGVDGITTDFPETLNQLVIDTFRTADLNRDDVVNYVDWNWQNSGRGVDLTGLTKTAAYQMGDMDGDFDNDIADFVRFKDLYFTSMSTLTAGIPLVVPEPTVPVWMAWSLLLLFGRYPHRPKLRPALAHDPIHRLSGLST